MTTFKRTLQIEGKDIELELKRLSLRKRSEIMGIIESIVKKTEGANIFEKIESGIQSCVSSWNGGKPASELMDEIFEAEDAMKVIQEAMKGNSVTEDDRKKSE